MKTPYQKFPFFGLLSIASYLIALMFISFNMTGYVVGGTGFSDYNGISTGAFVLGLFFTFLHFRYKKL